MKTAIKTLALAVAILAAGVIARMPTANASEDLRVDTALLVAQSTLNTAVVVSAPYVTNCRETAVYIQWSAGTSAGGVTVESAHDSTYAGTWAPIVVVPWSAANKQDVVQITGISANVRTRLSTAVVGGTVSTWLVCN